MSLKGGVLICVSNHMVDRLKYADFKGKKLRYHVIQ